MKLTESKLKYLELFQLAARLPSLLEVANAAGLSVSTVSHHLKKLENQLSVDLLDHAHRPLQLTPAGRIFLRHIDDALAALRSAEAEITSEDIVNVRNLRIALTHEFDSDIAPGLAVYLASIMPRCEFSHHARPSHEVLQLLRSRQIDIGISSRPSDAVLELDEYPLLVDPFVLAVPMDSGMSPDDFLGGYSKLPFLRFHREQIISVQIESQLRRLRVSLPRRFEFESHQSIMAVVANGLGWTITTPLGFTRALRFQNQVKLHRFPNKDFSRMFSLFAQPDHSRSMAKLVHRSLREKLDKQFVTPTHEQFPWLKGKLTLPSALP